MYAEAAVDGSIATAWTPTASTASLTVDLGQAVKIKQVIARWTGTAPAYTISTSSDGTTWSRMKPGTTARYVRVEVTRSGSGLSALEVYG
jgi:hypothetical protein